MFNRNAQGDRVKINSKIGQGTYSKTYSVSIHGKDESVMKRNFSERQIDWCFNLRELDLLARLKGHPFVVSIEAVSFDSPFKPEHPLTPRGNYETKDDSLYFFMEKMLINGRKFFVETDRNQDYFVHITILSCQLLLVLEYIHSKGIMHLDIKPDNMLIGDEKGDNDGYCGTFLRLADFGMSQNYCAADASTFGVITSWYRAPEVAMGIPYSYSPDIWSAGCVLYEMITARPLFETHEHDDSSVYNTILDRLPNPVDEGELDSMWRRSKTGRSSVGKMTGRGRVLQRKSLKEMSQITEEERKWFDSVFDRNDRGSTTDEFFDLIDSLLTFNPEKRKTATEALEMPFFEGLRDYIKEVRTRWQPEFDWKDIKVTVFPYIERQWIARTLADICNKYTDSTKREKEETWFSYRVAFQAISLFDRYIEWCEKNKEKKKFTSEFVGTFDSSRNIGFHFRVILYMSYKYFMDINSPCYPWELFVEDEMSTATMCALGKKFEEFMVEKVLKFKIYQHTPYEYFSNVKGGIEDVVLLIENYLKIDNFDGNLVELCEKLGE